MHKCQHNWRCSSWDSLYWCTICGSLRFHKTEAVSEPLMVKHAAALYAATERYVHGKADGDEINKALENMARILNMPVELAAEVVAK